MLKTLFITLLSLGNNASAQENLSTASENLKKATARVGVGELPIETLVGNAINAVLSFAGMIFFVFMVYAGYLWFTARGDDEQVKKATGIIKTTVAGIILLLSAGAITFFITDSLQSGPKTPVYNDTDCTKKGQGFSCVEISACIGKHLPDYLTQITGKYPGGASAWDAAAPDVKIQTLRSYCVGPNCYPGQCGGDDWRVCCDMN